MLPPTKGETSRTVGLIMVVPWVMAVTSLAVEPVLSAERAPGPALVEFRRPGLELVVNEETPD
jgi:hypothetical protein